MSEAEVLQTISRAEVLNGIGCQLLNQGEVEPARLHFLAALSVEPNNPRALQNLGAVLRTMQHYPAAEAIVKKAIVASGNNAFVRSNLGVVQMNLRRFRDALATLKGVTEDMPQSSPSWHNYGLVLYMVGRYRDALAAFDRALALGNVEPQLKSDRALTLLSLEQIQEGLEAYEVRWDILKKNKVWGLGIPEWKGEDLKGRRILVHHEQGFGDSIMLVRFLTPLAKLGGHITLVVPNELKVLFKRSFPFIEILALDDEALDGHLTYDFHSPMLSLMRWLKVEKPGDISPEPYLVGNAANVPMKLPEARFRVGLCWASGNHGPTHMERRRMAPLVGFLPLLERSDVALISLQKGKEVNDIIANGLEGLVFDLSPKLVDFAATADTIAALDFVISVDSAVAHLAGAMGKPCLMLSPYSRCWRWWTSGMGLPWYRGMQVFDQSQSGLWDVAIADAIRCAVRGMRAKEKAEALA